ncbi:MAG: transposase [Oscillospiraceae bacterium]
MASASAEFALAFHLSPENNHDAPEGRALIGNIVSHDKHLLLMDRAYEDEATRQAALDSGFIPVVPPKKNRRFPWEYDKELYKRRNEIEGYFRRLKRFRKVFTRYDKLDIIFIEVISITMILGVVLM